MKPAQYLRNAEILCKMRMANTKNSAVLMQNMKHAHKMNIFS